MLGFVFKAAVYGALIFWLVTSVDVAALKTALLVADRAFIAAAFLILLALSLVQAFRWALIARLIGVRIPILEN